jgi:hypothetical protein
MYPPQNFRRSESLRLEYENAIQQHPDANAAMERVRGVLTAIARLAGRTPASVGRSPKWTLIVQNMADTRRNLHQLLKGKQLCSVLLWSVHRGATRLGSLQSERCQRGNS